MAVRKFFLHVGPAKTGSSAVQYILRSHSDTSVVYPKVGLWADGSHHNLVFNFYADFRRPEVTRTDVHSLFEQIGEQTKQEKGNLVISSELLVGRDVGSFISTLVPYLAEADWAPEILFTCRDHFERAASLYNQRVKDGVIRERSDPRDYLLRQMQHLSYAPSLQKLAKSDIPMRVLNYHPAQDFVPRFLKHIGFADPSAIKNTQRNVGLSIKAMIATLAANNVAKTSEDRSRYFAALKRIRPFFAPSQFIFDLETISKAEILFREDREFLAREFGVHLPALNLERLEGQFFINDQQLNEIADAVADLEDEGKAIVEMARRYLRGSNVV